MLSSGEKFFLVLATGIFLLGILVNGFIVLVNCIDWVKRKKLPPSDHILISLAMSRIGLLCTLVWNSYVIVTSIDVTLQVRILDIILILTHNSNVWFSTTLSIFYFLKITNFSNPLFLWMKWRIDRMIFMLLWGPLIISFSAGFPILEKRHYYTGSYFSRVKDRNVSQEAQVNQSLYILFQVFFGLMSFIPFTLSTISFSLLIFSLWRHTRQMQLNAMGSRDPSTEAHVQAMKAVSSFLILFSLYYMCFYVNFLAEDDNILASMLSTLIMLLYPFGHSVILVLWNSKLRKAALRVSVLIRCCPRGSHLQALWVPLGIIWHFLGGKKSA
ncbi:taste receptor type 2 member 7-like [Petaurus breviceps papuanus]|uniref:taste receptor type 2 member 7-like n=1 Tax=Petaurus breviceps papuanus TaxID=3040969 RepID=UPI0036DDDD4F